MKIVKDNPLIFVAFRRMEGLPKGSDAYLKVRDELFTLLLNEYAPAFAVGCKSWVRQYQMDPADCESLFQQGLLKAIESFRFSKMKKSKFNSILWLCINCGMKDHLRSMISRKWSKEGHLSLDGNYLDDFKEIHDGYESGREQSFEEHLKIFDTDDFSIGVGQKMAMDRLFKSVTPLQQKILIRLRDGMERPLIQRELGLSPSKLFREIKRIQKTFPDIQQEI